MSYYNDYGWRPYVPVAARRANARREMEKLRKKGKAIQPVEIDGRAIARSFWGKGWCDHLESFSDYENRLPRGRSYVRNGSVCHLEVQAGRIEAMVAGTELYKVVIQIKPLKPGVWKAVKDKCRGRIGSMLELLQGRISNQVMAIVSDRENGLFPKPGEIELSCSCPDWASMCKHVAAVLYGVGNRLDRQPELLFVLRQVEAEELIAAQVALPAAAGAAAEDSLDGENLSALFGVDVVTEADGRSAPAPAGARRISGGIHGRPARAAAPASGDGHRPFKPARRTAPLDSSAVSRGKELSQRPKPAARETGRGAAKRQPQPAEVFDPQAPTGAAIASLRRRAGQSVTEFAKALNVSAASVLRWESNPGPLRLYGRPTRALAALQRKLG